MTLRGGLFVTFEGGDGAGKGTQLSLAEEWLRAEGREVLRTREPGGSALGVALRELILHTPGEVAARAEALMYAADRAQNIATVVRPALDAGVVVLQDRYVDSSVAYQGVGRALDADQVRALSDWATGGLQPDLTVLLDLDPRAGLERVAAAGRERTWDRLEAEALEFHERVRQAFLAIAEAEPDRVLVVDASGDPQEIAAVVRARLADLL